MTVRLGADIGGTFTDLVLYDESTGKVFTAKTPSTPDAFEQGVITGIEKILGETGVTGDQVDFLSHGTTVGTNAVLEGEIPEIGLITNEGLRDVLEIGDQTRPELYNLFTEKPPVLIPRYLRKGVPGRMDYSGTEIDPLDEEQAIEAIEELAAEDVESIVVSMLFSYLNDDHERRIGQLIEEHNAELEYALSSQVYPEIREYDRTMTTVLNEAIKTTIQEYLNQLERETAELGIDVPLNIMHTGGGIFRTSQAVENAVRTVLSGPVAGAVAAQHVSAQEEFPQAIGMDMGGTSTDVSVIDDGEIVRTTEGEINDLPIKTPMIDISTVGAGGGSIAWIDKGGALRVGPQSAGADPGPICYGEGGVEPTVTDANLLLGRLNPEYFLGGEIELAIEQTRELFEEKIAEPMDKSVEEAAQSVIDVANASLSRELRKVTVERGEDPGEYALVAFGGAGPLQAASVAAEMDMQTVIIPRNPGVFSASGLLIADVRADESHSYREKATDLDVINEQFEELTERLLARFQDQGFDEDEVRIERALDMRYKGQSYELTVPVADDEGEPITDAVLAQTKDAFHEAHRQLYGHAREDEPLEIVILRISGRVPTTKPDVTVTAAAGDAQRGQQEVYFPEAGFVDTDIYERTAIPAGETITGPAILEEQESTTLIPRDVTATMSEFGNLRLSL